MIAMQLSLHESVQEQRFDFEYPLDESFENQESQDLIDLEKLILIKDEVEDSSNLVPTPGELLASTSMLTQIMHDIETVMSQIDCVDLLIWYNEQFLGDKVEKNMHIYILQETKESLRNEIGELSRQKAKYESHEQREAILPGLCTVAIEQVGDGQDNDNAVTFYLISIVRMDSQIKWTVKRRYSDFDFLHLKLKKHHPIVGDFDLPSKTLGIWHRDKPDQLSRSKALERYLQRLIDTPETCQSIHIKNFLSTSISSSNDSRLFKFKGKKVNIDDSFKRTQQKLRSTISSLKPKVKTQSVKDGGKKTVKEYFNEKKKVWTMRKGLYVPGERCNVNFGEDPKKTGTELLSVPLDEEQIYNTDASSESEIHWSDSSIDQQMEESNPAQQKVDFDDSNLSDTIPLVNTDVPMLNSVINLLLQAFQFKQQSLYLRQNAAKFSLEQLFGTELEM